MAVLSEQDLENIHQKYMQTSSSDRESLPLTKAELREAVDATDTWIDANSADYNNALPVAAKAALTSKQKTRLLTAVAFRRFEVE